MPDRKPNPALYEVKKVYQNIKVYPIDLVGGKFNIHNKFNFLALDFVDITAILEYKGSDPKLAKIRDWVKADVESGEASAGAPFLPRYEGDYITDHEINIQSIANYVKMQNKKVQKVAN